MQCPQCGNDNPASNKFCSKCGADLAKLLIKGVKGFHLLPYVLVPLTILLIAGGLYLGYQWGFKSGETSKQEKTDLSKPFKEAQETKPKAPGISGKYVSQDNLSEYLELKPNGTFYLRESGIGVTGEYEVEGDVITLKFELGLAAKGKIQGDTIIDEEGKIWVKSSRDENLRDLLIGGWEEVDNGGSGFISTFLLANIKEIIRFLGDGTIVIAFDIQNKRSELVGKYKFAGTYLLKIEIPNLENQRLPGAAMLSPFLSRNKDTIEVTIAAISKERLFLAHPQSPTGFLWSGKYKKIGRGDETSTPRPLPMTKDDLVSALRDLKGMMLKKIDSDIRNTAQAFTDVKEYWRIKRWADIFTAPLRVLEGTLSLLARAANWSSLTEAANDTLDKSEAVYQVLATIMMVQDLQEAGEKLHYGLDGPTYIAAIERMLEAADATTLPPDGFSSEHYKQVIENHLYGTAEDIPLVIPRMSTTLTRRVTEFAKGALQMRSSISKKFNDLIAEIEAREMPQDFPIDEAIAQITSLKTQVLKSMSSGVDIAYKAYLRDGDKYVPVQVKTKLGAVGDLYKTFGQIAGRVAEKVRIEARVEVLKLMEAGENAALLYTITYKIPGAEEIKVAQKANVLAKVLIKSHEKSFYKDVEEQFYMLPQEMMLSLPTELTNIWMIAEDIDQYLRHLLR